jgi:O-antigen/teichoic acid export membrane protein
VAVRERVTRSALLLLGGRAVSAATQLAVTLLLAHHLTKVDFGRFAVVTTLLALLNVGIDFGGNLIGARDMARAPARAGGIVGTLLAQKALFAAGGYAVALGVLLAAGEPVAFASLVALAVFVYVLSPFEVVFQVRLEMGLPVAVHALERLAFVAILAALALSDRLSVETAVLFFVLTTAVGSVAVAHFAARRVPPASPDPPVSRFLATQSAQGVASLCAATYFYLDTFYLRFFRGVEDVATYSAAYRIFSFGAILPSMVMQAVFPVLSGFAGADRERFASAYREVLSKLLQVALPVLAAAPALAPGAVALLYPKEAYAAASVPLVWLAGAFAAVTVGAVSSHSLVALGAQSAWMRVTLAALVLNAAGNLVAVPLAGPAGAAAMTFATEAFVAALCVARVREIAGVTPFSRQLVPALASAAGAALGSLLALAAGFWAGLGGALALGVAGYVLARGRR